MGQKANPISLRLPILKNWSSRWINKTNYSYLLFEDLKIKELINKKLTRASSIARIEIERSIQDLKITIHTAKPGILIGRSGQGITDLKKLIKTEIEALRRNINLNCQKSSNKNKPVERISLEIIEIRDPELHAKLMALNIANQLEKRVAYRRAIKQAISKISLKAKGVKIKVSGRLNGVEIARREKFSQGNIPLSSFKANIDYAQENAYTTYGVIGIKVWIHKRENKVAKINESHYTNITNKK